MGKQVSWPSLKKLTAIIVGPILVLVGIALLVLPGPGLLLIAAGITLLGTEYHWARRLVEPIKKRLQQAKKPREVKAEGKRPSQD